MALRESLTRERLVFLALCLLLGWQAWQYVFDVPPPPDAPPPALRQPPPVETPDSLAELSSFRTYMERGEDVFVPRDLVGKDTRVIEPPKPRNGGEPEQAPRTPPRRRTQPPPTDGAQAVIPDKPVQRPEVTPPQPPAAPEEEEYQLPVQVSGWAKVAPGEPRKVIVFDRNTGEYFTMGQGDEYRGAQVVDITAASVTFENERGKRLRIDRAFLLNPPEAEE